MRRSISLAAACAALLLSACDGASPAAPQDAPRALGGCQWAKEGCDPPDPTNVASMAYSTTGVRSVGTLLKSVTVTGRSEAFSGVASSSVSTELKFSADCSNSWVLVQSKSATALGSPAVAQVQLTDSRDKRVLTRWKAWSTHSFTPASGYTGGGTLYTQWDSDCFSG